MIIVLKELFLCLHSPKKAWILSFVKIRLVWESSFMRADGQTDVTKLIVAFRKFATSPKNPANFKPRKKIVILSVNPRHPWTVKPQLSMHLLYE
jgi:hypothetical protein